MKDERESTATEELRNPSPMSQRTWGEPIGEVHSNQAPRNCQIGNNLDLDMTQWKAYFKTVKTDLAIGGESLLQQGECSLTKQICQMKDYMKGLSFLQSILKTAKTW